jgi:hypothetical protein
VAVGYCLSHILLAALLFSAGATGFEQPGTPPSDLNVQKARGAITQVTSLDDPTQSYWVYLPSRYSTERAWPILYAFDPFARGRTAVEVYKDAAEKYGYIVAGSNNSRNGQIGADMTAAQAMWLDTHRRFKLDKDRVYATGLSGGARLATALALYCSNCAVAGVIAQAAGYPLMKDSAPAPANDHFAYYATVGDGDFNYPEVLALRKKKDEAGAPCKVKIFPGLHQWAPPEVVDGALAWLELRAMQAGTEKPDAGFVANMFTQTQNEANDAEQRGDVLTEYYALRSLVDDFKGLEDTSAFAQRLAQLRGSKALQKAERDLQREFEKQATVTADAAQALARFGGADADTQADLRRRIVSTMSDLHRRANSKDSDHNVYLRAYWQLLIQDQESGSDAFQGNRLAEAQGYFELMVEAAPDLAWPELLLAEVDVRAGNKKAALKAIQAAVQRGLKHAQSLTQDPELQPLASDPEFQRIVQGLSAP